MPHNDCFKSRKRRRTSALGRIDHFPLQYKVDILFDKVDNALIFPKMENMKILSILSILRLVVVDASSGLKLFPKLIEIAGNKYLFQQLFMNEGSGEE